jgi:hypothetical protein
MMRVSLQASHPPINSPFRYSWGKVGQLVCGRTAWLYSITRPLGRASTLGTLFRPATREVAAIRGGPLPGSPRSFVPEQGGFTDFQAKRLIHWSRPQGISSTAVAAGVIQGTADAPRLQSAVVWGYSHCARRCGDIRKLAKVGVWV